MTGSGTCPPACDAIHAPCRGRGFGAKLSPMFSARPLLAAFALGMAFAIPGAPELRAEEEFDFSDLARPEHDYWNRTPKDPFTRLKDDLEQGRLALDESSEKAYLESLLKALEIPTSSQMLVYSTTSLQLSLISPRTPRALYFNDEIYLGYVVGGKIEIISIDPELGAIFYLFDFPKDGVRPVAERSRRCMNCHSDEDTREVPGLVVKSVIPGPRGGSLESYRRGLSGHGIPLSDRFGGWHVTGAEGMGPHWGNLTGNFTPEGIVTTPLPPGAQFEWSVFPVATSDVLPHLLHEHQAGFVNRGVEAHYRLRTALAKGKGRVLEGDRAMMEELVEELSRYLLFADEAPLPDDGIAGDPAFKEAFLAKRRTAASGDSLRDFDLKTQLFRNRCSYMIYSPLFQSLPEGFRRRVYERIDRALAASPADPDLAHLRPDEKSRIRAILEETVPGWPK